MELTAFSSVVCGLHVGKIVTTSFMVAVAVETIAGEAVSEQTPDSQEVTVTSVVCCFDSVVETGHHVVYSVTAPLIVAVVVETIAEEVTLEQMSDSQEVTVTSVVCFAGTVVEIGHHVVYSVVTVSYTHLDVYKRQR